jgi:outer membrane protein OmpA-like peptidoglycan-associated protein
MPKPTLFPICLLIVVLLLGMGQPLDAQEIGKKDRATKLMDQGRYGDAARILKRKAKRNEEDAELQERYGDVLKELHRFEESAAAYDRAELMSGLSNEGLLHYGQVLFKLGEVDRAEDVIKRYATRVPNSFIAQLMLRSMERVNEWSQVGANFIVGEVPGINSRFSEFAPIHYKDGLIFATARNIDHVNESASGYANEPYLAVYRASFEEVKKSKDDSLALPQAASFKRPKVFLRNLTGDYNIGPAAINEAQNKIIYTVAKDRLGKGERNNLELHEAFIKKDRRIKKDQVLYSSDSASFAHPSISPNGQFLVFASDMAQDSTGMDLYLVSRTDSNGWGEPRRLPATINTPLDEVFPYLKNDSTLYFSSNGHPGYGGLDFFVSKLRKGRWTNPINAKAPINSSKDDFGICFVDSAGGYFSSSRAGGAGRDDIYAFTQIASEDDTNRTDIQGVFEYANLPPEGAELALLDANDNVLSTTFTDAKGNFIFEGLPVGKDYKIKVLNPTDDMVLNANIFIVNADGEAVVQLEHEGEASFRFKTLPKDEIAGLTPLDELDDAAGMTYDIFGQLLAELDEDMTDIKLVAETDDGRIIAITYTDSNGYYSFYDLPKAEYLEISAIERDSIVYRSSIFYADDSRSEQLTETGNEYFTYKFKVINEDTRTVTPPARYSGFVKLDDKALEGIPVVIFDENNKIVEVMRTNAQGMFELRHTQPDATYKLILPDSFQVNKIEPNIYLVDRSSKRVIKTTSITLSLYRFFTPESIMEALSEQDLAYFNAAYEINGQVFKEQPGDYAGGVRIDVFDEEGNLVEASVADEDGKFSFKQLRPDEAYLFKPLIEDKGAFQLVIFDENGVASEYLRFADLQDYMYTTLQQEQVKRLEQLEAGDSPMSPVDDFIAGQIYYKLPGDYKQGIMVYAFDDKGNIIDSTLTDGKGNFTFERLSNSENFKIQVMDEIQDNPLNVALFNYNGTFLGLLALDGDNAFQYSKILLEAASELGSLDAKDKSQGLMYGQVYRELPGDYNNSLKIYAFDENGNLLDVAQMDDEGRFRFTKLTEDDNYVFRITEDDTEFNIALMDRSGNILDRLHVFNGQWTYDKLAYESYEIKLIEELDAAQAAGDLSYKAKLIEEESNAEGKKTVLYGYRSAELNQDDLDQLDAIINRWEANPSEAIQIQSHSDKAEKKGSYSFSAERSVAVARYLHDQGVPLSAMFISNWESEQPIIDCATADCDESERSKNRRSELQLIASEGLASEPDYVITFGFNEWRLDSEAEKTVYQVLQLLRNNPNQQIRIDGFTDTWGTFESNQRVSELRAKNIRNLLRLRGIEESNMEVVFHGETIPRGPCILDYPCPVELRNTNRRVEIRLK